jgi:hypothetical protein
VKGLSLDEVKCREAEKKQRARLIGQIRVARLGWMRSDTSAEELKQLFAMPMAELRGVAVGAARPTRRWYTVVTAAARKVARLD